MVAHQPRGMVEARLHVLACQGGILGQHVLNRVAGREKLDHRLRRNTGAAHDRPAVADVGMRSNALGHGGKIAASARKPSAKLILGAHEIRKIIQALEAGGRALVPLRMYFKGALVKVEIALCSGKKLYDKRDDLKQRAEARDLDKALKHLRRR